MQWNSQRLHLHLCWWLQRNTLRSRFIQFLRFACISPNDPAHCCTFWSYGNNFEIGEWVSNLCQNSVTCSNDVNGNTCTLVLSAVTQEHLSYRFVNVDVLVKLSNCFYGIWTVSEIEECLSNPCQNSATCNELVNGYTCTCADGFTGTICDLG